MTDLAAGLTERDRAVVAGSAARQWGWGQRPALVLIDLYRAVFGDEPQPLPDAMAAWPRSCGLEGWTALAETERLLSAARSSGIPVIHVTGDPTVPVWSRGAVDSEHFTAAMRLAAVADFEIMPSVQPQEGEYVIRKSAPSAFFGTPMASLLSTLGVDSVIVAGESTSGCVRASVVDACALRLKVAVVKECVFDQFETAHEISLFDMDRKYADVVFLTAALQQLSTISPGKDTVNE